MEASIALWAGRQAPAGGVKRWHAQCLKGRRHLSLEPRAVRRLMSDRDQEQNGRGSRNQRLISNPGLFSAEVLPADPRPLVDALLDPVGAPVMG